MKKSRLWKKFIRILLFRVPVITLAGLSIISLIATWAFEFRLLFLNVLPLIFGGLTIGTILQTFLLAGEDIARQAMDELKAEMNNQHDQRLDTFHQRLAQDGDPRTEKALQDLRELATAIKQSSTDKYSKLDAHARVEMHFKVDKLFEKCISLLEKSLSLLDSAKEISDPTLRNKVLKIREKNMDEIKTNISYLGHILEKIQTINFHENKDNEEYVSIMRELDEGMEIALRVDEQMRKLESDHKIRE